MSRLSAWTLNAVYLALLAAALPWILWSAVRHGKHREGFAAKLLGMAPRRLGDRPCVWLHAVSVGEVNLLATIIPEFARRQPDWEIVISTTTKTGFDLARRKYSDRTVFYAPLDFSWATARAMRRVRPTQLVLAELELWPNLIAAARRRAVKVAIVNGRLSDKSFRGYRRVRPLVARALRRLDLIAAQNNETAERFVALGARRESVVATGSLKFDGALTDRDNSKTLALKELAGITSDDIVLLAGSTQDPEEQYAVDIFHRLSAKHQHLRLILVPRHPERFDEVAAMLDRSGVPWQRRSMLSRDAGSRELTVRRETSNDSMVVSLSAARRRAGLLAANEVEHAPAHGSDVHHRWSVLLVDTVGELGAWWGAASVGFVGGSFGSRGGQNMLEPAAYGVATCFGPNTWNFRDIVAQLLAAEGARVVNTPGELESFVRWALQRPGEARSLGERARRHVLSQQGAAARTADLLVALVKSESSAAPANLVAA